MNPDAMSDPGDTEDLNVFRKLVEATIANKLASADVSDVRFGRILDTIETLDEWDRAGDVWLRRLLLFPRKNLPTPQWIVKREHELRDSWQMGTDAPSRLPADLIGPASG